jgi:broad specificity phosphatase PhoE
VNAAGVESWRSAYDAAGLHHADAPPETLVRAARTAHHILASDLPRAVGSAARLAPGREVAASPLLRETPLPIPPLAVHLPFAAWALVIHLHWLRRIAAGSEAAAAELARAAAAAGWLGERVAEGETAMVVTHGAFRRLLGRALAADGWRAAPGLRRYHPWSTWVFEREP